MLCPKCKKEIEMSGWFCPYCGEMIEETPTANYEETQSSERVDLQKEIVALELTSGDNSADTRTSTISAEDKKQVKKWLIVQAVVMAVALLMAILSFVLPIYGRGERIIEHIMRYINLNIGPAEDFRIVYLIVEVGCIILWLACSAALFFCVGLLPLCYAEIGKLSIIIVFIPMLFCVGINIFNFEETMIFSIFLLIFSIVGWALMIVTDRKLRKFSKEN